MSSDERAVRVFISSTFRDMHGERDHLVTVVFPLLRERLELLGLEFFDVDLRWGVPQTGVDGELANPWVYCRQWIDRVEPFFISLLGERYGWVPMDEDIPDPEEREAYRGNSITEMEIRHAALDTGLRRTSYFYLRKSKVPACADSKIRREFVDAGEEARLGKLKGRILRAGRPVRFYPCRWTGTGFADFEEFGQMVLDDIWSGVLRDKRYVPKDVWREALGKDPDGDPRYNDSEQPIPEDLWQRLVNLARPAPADPLELEAQQMRAFEESRLRWFQGREEELGRLGEFVQGDLPEGASRLAVLRSDPGQGKSALLARFVNELSSGPHWVFEHFAGATARSLEVHFLLERLILALDGSGIDWHEEDGGPPDLRRRLNRRLADYRGDRRIVIVVDGVDQLGIDWLPAAPGPNVRIIISCIGGSALARGSREAEVLAALESRRPAPRWVELAPLTPADVRSIVTGYLREYCKELDREQIDAICEMEQARNPLYLQVMLAELRTLGGNDMHRTVPRLIADLRRRRPDSRELFDWVLERLEVFGAEAVRSFCAYLAVSRRGMSGRELGDLLARRLGEEGARASRRIERGLRRYLLRRGAEFGFFHGQLREAVERRYLQGADPAAYHREIARYFLSRGIGDDHALTELAWHLSRGRLTAELHALIDDPEFQRRRISRHGTVHDLCADIGLALGAAMETGDAAPIARFGFLNAAYREGRFGKQDVLGLHRLDPPAAFQEARLFRGLARFRLLVLLAVRESAAGQIESASRLVADAAALRGITLPAADAPFLAGAVASLVETGVAQALQLVPAVLRREDAFRCALSAAERMASAALPAFLSGLVSWMDKEIRDPNGVKAVDEYDALIQAVIRLEDEAVREELLGRLAGMIESLRTPLEVAVEQQDVWGGIGILMAQIHASLEAGAAKKKGLRDRDGYMTVMRAYLGSALAEREQDQRGPALLDLAIEACGDKASDEGVFWHVTRAFIRLRAPESSRQLQRLVAKLKGDRRAGQLGIMLEILASTTGREDLIEVLDEIGARLSSLPLTRRVRLLGHLARAYGAAGKHSLVRQVAKRLHLPLGQLGLVRWNPLISAEKKFAMLYDIVDKVSRLGERDQDWTGAWIARLAKWLTRVASLKERTNKLIALLQLAADCRVAAGVNAVIDIVLSMKDNELCAEGLESALDAAQVFDQRDRALIRARAWEWASHIADTPARARVQHAWWRTAGTDDAGRFEEAAAGVRALADPAQRAAGLGQAAATLGRLGQAEAAERAWYDAALADQAAAAGAIVLGARVAAVAEAGEADDWNAVLAAVACPDCLSGTKAVQIAARACREPKRLAALGRAVRRLKWREFELQPLLAMNMAVARAWGEAGDPSRGARIALRAFRRVRRFGRSRGHDQGLVAELLETALVLQDSRLGRRLLFSLIPFVFSGGYGKPARLIELADGFKNIRDDRTAKLAFTHLYRASLEMDPSSRWRIVEAAGGIAGAMAGCGQAGLAYRLLENIRLPKKGQGVPEGEPFEESSMALALGQLARAHGLVHASGAYQGNKNSLMSACSQALRAASELTTDMMRKEACKAQILVWEAAAAGDLHLEAAAALQGAEANARTAAAGAISRWEGLTDLSLAWARRGEVGRALAAAREIRDSEARDGLLVGLMEIAREKDPDGLIECWREIASPAGRVDAAWAAARNRLRLPAAQREVDSQADQARASWPAPAYRSYIPVAVLALSAAGYWLALRLWPAVRAGLGGPAGPWWTAGLAGAVIAGLIGINRANRHFSEWSKPALRLPLSLISLPFLPILLAVWLGNRRKETRPALRAWLYGFRLRSRRRKRPPVSPTESRTGDADPYRRLLREAADDTEPFDLLLGAWMAAGGMSEESSAIVAAVPELRVPVRASAQVREQNRLVEEAERDRRWAVRSRRKFRSVVSKIGIFLSLGIVYWPIDSWNKFRFGRRQKRVRRLVAEGHKMIRMNRWARAVGLFERAVRIEPDIPEYWHDYSIALSRAGRKEEGIAACRKACETGRGSDEEPQLWYGLGYQLFQECRYREALVAFEHCLTIAKPGTQDYTEAEKGREFCRTNLGL